VHKSSLEEMRKFADSLPARPLRIADVGSCDVNGQYRSIFERPEWKYIGLDVQAGKNVDVVLPSEYEWNNIQDGAFDVVVSGQALEHTRFPWLFVKELARIVRPGGAVCIIAPYQWDYHKFPIDCWRVYPDGMRAVMEHSGLTVISTHMNDNGDPHFRGDTVGVARKPYVSVRTECACPPPKDSRSHVVQTISGKPFLCCGGRTMKKNLSYFLYPLKGSNWKWNVSQLKPFLPAFNGRKIVSVAEGPTTDLMEEVKAHFNDSSVEFVGTKNDPGMKEMASFLGVLEKLRSLDPLEATFYAHAKGVYHWSRTMRNVMAWASAMYTLNLSDIGAIERVLQTHATAGAFRKMYLSGTSWHFSGTFYWLKHSELFSGDWKRADPGPMGVENYPACQFPIERSFDLSLGRSFPHMYLNSVPEEEVRSALDELRDTVYDGLT
jgi:hypothetical protein